MQSQRRTVQRGMPTWAVLCIVGAVALIGFFVVRQWMAETGEISYDPQERYNQAVIAFNEGEVNRAMTELGRIDLDVATPELKTKVEELRARVEAGDKSQEIEARYVQATKILDTQLKRYEEKYLRGNDVSRAKARLFVKRCDDFRHEFPGHPDMEWVTRFRDRWSELADLSEPATVEDVAWEVKMLTGGKPRDYTEVFRLLNDVVKRADGADRDAALAMLDTQEAERTEYFEDRMQQARWHWEREEYGQAFEWLVQVATKIGDDEMRDRAADALVKMVDKQGRPLTDRFMEGYKRDRPWQFEDMLKVPALKEAAQRSGLL
ncbi:MAG: hypothetical protein H6828_01675 [Planctomycetes bacterium]|nr:hypothetical protein [Planctomycetota bacterium]